MTTKRDDSSANQRKPDERKTKPPDTGRAGANHRLRGTELNKDFSDAEGDSCVVAPKRDEKQSDS